MILDNYYTFKYSAKTGIYYMDSEKSKQLGIDDSLPTNLYSYGILFVQIYKNGFYLEYHPDFNNNRFHTVNKIAYWGSHNWFELYDDEKLKTMKMNSINWYLVNLYQNIN